jgi:hypothetical protein
MFGIADKVLAIAFAVLMVLFAVAAGVQTVRINGVSFFGWYAIDGYKPLYLADERNMAPLRSSVASLNSGLNQCNASVNALGDATKKLTGAAQGLVDQAANGQKSIADNIAAVSKMKTGDEKCAVADSIIKRAFQ